MSAIALVGSVTLLLREDTLSKLLQPLVAFAAGAMIGGALFHMLPAALIVMPTKAAFFWVAVGFSIFFAVEQLLHWHQCRRAAADRQKPLTYLVLLGDGLHNFLGGLAIAGVFLTDIHLGIAAWLAAAAHEVPQELGDFAVLVQGGWKKGRALVFNFAPASDRVDVQWLVPLAAGNFLYIGASDLVPEVNKPHSLRSGIVQFGAFVLGIALLQLLAAVDR